MLLLYYIPIVIYFFFPVCYFFRAEILDGDKILVIKNVVPSDEGAYICEAHNSVGEISSKAQLVVNCKYLDIKRLKEIQFNT